MELVCPGCDRRHRMPPGLTPTVLRARCDCGRVITHTAIDERPAARAIPALTLRRRAAPPSESPPELPPAGELPDGPDAPLTGYLIVRGEARPLAAIGRRRLVSVAARRTGAAPRARIFGHPADFGRRAPATPPIEPVELSTPPARRALHWPALGLAFALALTLIPGLGALSATVEAPPPRVARPAAAAHRPAPPPRTPPPPLPARYRAGLSVELVDVERRPGALVVHGHLHNGTDAPRGDIRLHARLGDRVRDAWCCDFATGTAADRLAADPADPHFTDARPRMERAVLAPGEGAAFSFVFPDAPPDAAPAARVVLRSARPLDPL